MALDVGESVDQIGKHAECIAVAVGELLHEAGDRGQCAVRGVHQRIDQISDWLGHGAAREVIDHVLHGGDQTVAFAGPHAIIAACGEQAAKQTAQTTSTQHGADDGVDQILQSAAASRVAKAGNQTIERVDQWLQRFIVGVHKAVNERRQRTQSTFGVGQVFDQASHRRQRAGVRVDERVDQIHHRLCHRAAQQAVDHGLHRGDQSVAIIGGLGRIGWVSRLSRICGLSWVGWLSWVGRLSRIGGLSWVGWLSRICGLSWIGRLSRICGLSWVGRLSRICGLSWIGRLSRIGGLSWVGRLSRIGGLSWIGRLSRICGLSWIGRLSRVCGLSWVGRLSRICGLSGVSRIARVGWLRWIGRIGRLGSVRRIGGIRWVGWLCGLGRLRQRRGVRWVCGISRIRGVGGFGWIRWVVQGGLVVVIVVIGATPNQGTGTCADEACQQEIAQHRTAGIVGILGDDQAHRIVVTGGRHVHIAARQVEHQCTRRAIVVGLRAEGGFCAASKRAHQLFTTSTTEQRLGAAVCGNNDLVADQQLGTRFRRDGLAVTNDLYARRRLRQNGSTCRTLGAVHNSGSSVLVRVGFVATRLSNVEARWLCCRGRHGAAPRLVDVWFESGQMPTDSLQPLTANGVPNGACLFFSHKISISH